MGRSHVNNTAMNNLNNSISKKISQTSSQLLMVFLISLSLSQALAAEESIGNSLMGSDGQFRGDSKWSNSYFSFSSVGLKQTQDGAASISMYNYLAANYKLSKDERINLRPVFMINTAGYDQYKQNQASNIKAGDAIVNYSNYSIALLPGEWQWGADLGLVLPTSESSQNKKMIAALKSHSSFEKEYSNDWATVYNLKPYYYFQSQKAYRNEYDKIFDDGGTQHRIDTGANQIAKLEHYMTVAKYANKYFTPAFDIGFIHQWYYTSDQVRGGSASRNQMKIAPNTEIHVNSRLWFILGVESDVDLNNSTLDASSGDTFRWRDDRDQSINFFRPENTQYYLLTFWSL